MGGALGGIAKMATGAGGGLGAAVLGGTKVGQLLSAFGGGGATPNPFGGLLTPAATGGQVPNYGVQTPTPGAGFNAFEAPSPVSAAPTPQVTRGGYLSPPATPGAAVAQTRQNRPPNQNEAFAYRYLMGKNLSSNAAAGIVGNLAQESSFADDVLSGRRRGDKGASGFAAQWQGQRLRNLQAYSRTPTPSLPQQLDFIFEEANPKSPYFDAGAARAMSLIQNAQSPAQAADIFRDHFERPLADDRASRRAFAQRAFANYGNSTGIQAVSSAQAGAGAGVSVTPFDAGGIHEQIFTGIDQLYGGMQAGAGFQGGAQSHTQSGTPTEYFSGPQAQARRQAAMQVAFGSEQKQQEGQEPPPQDLGLQEVAGVQQSLTQKRLGEQQQSRQQTRKQELLKKTRGLS